MSIHLAAGEDPVGSKGQGQPTFGACNPKKKRGGGGGGRLHLLFRCFFSFFYRSSSAFISLASHSDPARLLGHLLCRGPPNVQSSF